MTAPEAIQSALWAAAASLPLWRDAAVLILAAAVIGLVYLAAR